MKIINSLLIISTSVFNPGQIKLTLSRNCNAIMHSYDNAVYLKCVNLHDLCSIYDFLCRQGWCIFPLVYKTVFCLRKGNPLYLQIAEISILQNCLFSKWFESLSCSALRLEINNGRKIASDINHVLQLLNSGYTSNIGKQCLQLSKAWSY